MTDTITVLDGTGNTTVPLLVDGYQADQASRLIVTDLLAGGIAVTLLPPNPRAGTLRLVYATGAAAESARQLHLRRALFTLASTEQPTVNMTYAVASVSPVLEDTTRAAWVLSVSFQEVTT